MGGLIQLVAVGVQDINLSSSFHHVKFNNPYNFIWDWEWEVIKELVDKTVKTLIKVCVTCDECPICLEDFSKESYKGYITNCCGKIFHSKCLSKWLRGRERCPHCRGNPYEYTTKRIMDDVTIQVCEEEGLEWGRYTSNKYKSKLQIKRIIKLKRENKREYKKSTEYKLAKKNKKEINKFRQKQIKNSFKR